MFGMQDPSQTLLQIERYLEEGRLELAEVMATQFSELMLANKKREAQDRIFLLKGLRLMCDIALARGKAAQNLSTIKRMHTERKTLTALLRKHAPAMLDAMQPEHEDHLRAGRLYAAAGKHKAAAKAYAKCEALVPGHLAAALAAAQSSPSKATLQRLLTTLASAGPVIHAQGLFLLRPDGSPEVLADHMVATLRQNSSMAAGLGERCEAEAQRLEAQKAAIIAGEQAANEQLQSALNALQPKHDYYEYG